MSFAIHIFLPIEHFLHGYLRLTCLVIKLSCIWIL